MNRKHMAAVNLLNTETMLFNDDDLTGILDVNGTKPVKITRSAKRGNWFNLLKFW